VGPTKDQDGQPGGFFEEDEDVAVLAAIFERGPHGRTAPAGPDRGERPPPPDMGERQ